MMNIYKTLFLHSLLIRRISKLDTKSLFNSGASTQIKTTRVNYSTQRHKSYSKELGAIYVNFIIALLHNKLNLDRSKLKSYSNIIKFLEDYKGDKLFTKSYLSKLRYRGQFKKVPLTRESLDFINYVKKTFPEFNDSYFTYKHTDNTLDYNYPVTTYPTDAYPDPKGQDIQPKAVNQQHVSYKTKDSFSLLRKLSTKQSFSSRSNKYLWIYEEIAYFFILLPYFILLILAIKDNPELLDVYIKEWNTDVSINTQTMQSDTGKSFNIITYPDFVAVDLQTENNGTTNYYERIEGSDTETVTTKTKASLDTIYPMDVQAIDQQSKEITNNYSYSVNFNEDDQATKDMCTREATTQKCYKTKRKSSWLFSMLDFNNLNYFPSLFEDLSKPRETYTILQSNDSMLNNQDTSIYKRYTNNAASPCYLKKAILHHENLIYTENTTASSSEANQTSDIISFVSQANPVHVEATAKATNTNSFSLGSTKVDIVVASSEAAAENITLNSYPSDAYPDPKDQDQQAKAMDQQKSSTLSRHWSEEYARVTQKTNTTSLNYNLNRDSVSSTYSKYFYSEDISDKVDTLRSQVNDKDVANTQVKLFVSEHIDNTEDTNNKKIWDTANTYPQNKQANKFSESAMPEPVTPEQVSNTDLSNSLHTNIKNSKLHGANSEPLSPYSPSIISCYTDTPVANTQTISATVPHIDADTSVDLQTKTSDSMVATHNSKESFKYSNDLSLPEVKLTRITPPATIACAEDYINENTDSSLDLIVPETKPTKITPPLVKDDYDLSSFTYTHPELDSPLNIDTVNNPEHITNSTDNKLKLNTDFNTLQITVGNSSLNIEEIKGDLTKVKNIIANNNNHILDFKLNLDTLRERVNNINDECSSLLNEKEALNIKLYNNKHNTEQFNMRTIDNDNTLTSIYRNAYNSFMQWGLNTASPVKNSDIISKLISIDNKLNSLQETKLDLLNNINNNINSIAKLYNHNLLLRELLEENSTALPST